MRLPIVSLALLAASFFSATAAHADVIDYTLTGDGNTITFSLDSANYYGASVISIYSVPYVMNGSSGDADLQFSNQTDGTYTFVFEVPDPPFEVFTEAPLNLYSYTDSIDPAESLTLLTGTFSFSGYTLTAVDPSAVGATPEPSSLILLGTGILGVAGAARRRIFAARSSRI